MQRSAVYCTHTLCRCDESKKTPITRQIIVGVHTYYTYYATILNLNAPIYMYTYFIIPPIVGKGAISVAFVRPSVAYVANNSRTQRPSVPKFQWFPTFDETRTPVSRSNGRSSGLQRRAGAYRVGRTRRPHCLFCELTYGTTMQQIFLLQQTVLKLFYRDRSKKLYMKK